MRRLVGIFLCIMLVLGMAGCAQADTKTTTDSKTPAASQQAASQATVEAATTKQVGTTEQAIEEDEEITAATGRVLVAYFSRTGNTRPLAEYAAEYYGADLHEIIAKEPYSDADINYNDSNSRATMEQNDQFVRPEIGGAVANMDRYDTIILAYPIWWGQAPRIINTFLEAYDFSGKTIIPFCTSASSGIGSSDDDLHTLVSSSVQWIDGKRFAAGTSAEELTAWLAEVFPATGQSIDNQSTEDFKLKLFINDKEIPVTWEHCTAVDELMAEAASDNIVISMSMYGGWEQVGFLGHSYTTDDRQMTAVNGDIVLYSGNQIVVFYGSNSWSYTKLGKMDLSVDEVTELLSKGDITLTITRK